MNWVDIKSCSCTSKNMSFIQIGPGVYDVWTNKNYCYKLKEYSIWVNSGPVELRFSYTWKLCVADIDRLFEYSIFDSKVLVHLWFQKPGFNRHRLLQTVDSSGRTGDVPQPCSPGAAGSSTGWVRAGVRHKTTARSFDTSSRAVTAPAEGSSWNKLYWVVS